MTETCLFFGTPEFAIPSLDALVASPYEVAAVVTRPDKPGGRGRRVQSSPVKRRAQELGLPVLQPPRLRDPDALTALRSFHPDFVVVAAYGLLIPPAVLELPPSGVLNVHPSLLPRHRGASPIPAAILAGDEETGVSIMLMDEGLDTGPVLSQRRVAVEHSETTGELSRRLAEVSAELLLETIPLWLGNQVEPQPQDDSLATYSPQLKKEDGAIDWSGSAQEIARKVRAFNPWPGASTRYQDKQLSVWRAYPAGNGGEPDLGRVLGIGKFTGVSGPESALLVGCGQGRLAIIELQKEGKRRLSAEEFVRGEREIVGAVLGS